MMEEKRDKKAMFKRVRNKKKKLIEKKPRIKNQSQVSLRQIINCLSF
jgi:hypothetical protein